MSAPKIAVVFGTRPEAIKLAPVILELQKAGLPLQAVVCVTGQHREMLAQVLEWFRIRPDYDLNLMEANQSLAEFTGKALTALHALFSDLKPDIVMVQGDTTSAMSAALTAFYHQIPVAHVEAGLRTGELFNPFPEEMNRRIAGMLARYHFAPTENAARALIAEKARAETVFNVGNTVVDALRLTMERQAETEVSGFTNGRRGILVTAHRRESFGSPFEEICLAIRDIADRNESVEVVYPVHLNPSVQDPVSRFLRGHPRIRLLEPLRYEQFVRVMSQSHLVLTDSGGVQEEATVLGKPTLILRNTTERPEVVTAGTAALVGTSRAAIISATEQLLQDEGAYREMAQASSPFGDGFAARRIVQILASVG